MTGPGDLADRLRSIRDDLDELAFDQLREAMADGASERPTSDKEYAKARRAIDKAIHVLDHVADA